MLLALAAIWLPIQLGQWGETLQGAQDRHVNPKTWALVGVARQGLLATAACLPLFWNRRRAPYLIIPFLLAVAPDFDHVMAAREQMHSRAGHAQAAAGESADPQADDELEYVPLGTHDFTHSLILLFIAAGVLLVFTQRLDWAWVLIVARTSHTIRSAHTAPLAIFYPDPTLYEIGLWPYLYWHAALGAMTFGVMFIYEPVSVFLRRVMRVGAEPLALLLPHHTPPEWSGAVPPLRKSASPKHSHHSSRSSSRSRHRHSSDEGESHHHSSSRSRSHRRSRSSSSSRSSHSDSSAED